MKRKMAKSIVVLLIVTLLLASTSMMRNEVYAIFDMGPLTDVNQFISNVENLESGGKITLEKDIILTLREGLDITKDITIDLNGKTIFAQNGNNKNITVKNGATLTIKDTSLEGTGKIVSETVTTQGGRGVIDVENAKLIVESGTISATDGNGSHMNTILVYGGSVEKPSTVIVNGGTIIGEERSIANHNIMGGHTYIEVNGGSVVDGIYSSYTATEHPHNHDVKLTGGTIGRTCIETSLFAYEGNVVPTIEISDNVILNAGIEIGIYQNNTANYDVDDMFNITNEKYHIVKNNETYSLIKGLDSIVKYETNGGNAIEEKSVEYSGKAENIIPTKEFYEFLGWFTDENCKTAFDFNTKIKENTTLYASWEAVEEPELEVKETVSYEGILSSTLNSDTMDKLISSALEEKNNSEVKVVVNEENNKEVNEVKVVMPKNAIEKMVKEDDTKLVVESSVGTFEFDNKALKAIDGIVSTNVTSAQIVTLSIEKVAENSKLDKEMAERVGDRPLYSLNLYIDGVYAGDFKDGKVSVTVPYTLAEGEDVENLVVYCVDKDGKLEKRVSRYNETDKTVTFETSSFSYYTIAYELPEVSVKPEGTIEPEGTVKPEESKSSEMLEKAEVKNPDTGVNYAIYSVLFGVSLIALAAIVKEIKKDRK